MEFGVIRIGKTRIRHTNPCRSPWCIVHLLQQFTTLRRSTKASRNGGGFPPPITCSGGWLRWGLLISDVVCLSGTYLILLIRIRLYLCRLDYIYYCTYRLGYPYCPSTLGRLIVLSLLFSLGTFLLFPMDYLLCS